MTEISPEAIEAVSIGGASLRLRIITPQETLYDDEVTLAQLSTTVGIMELMPRHEPIMAPLALAPMTLTPANGNAPLSFAILGGFLDHNGNDTTILADAAEKGDEIDVERASLSMQRARERLDEVTRRGDPVDAGVDVDRARLALIRSLVRLQAAGKPHKGS